MKITVDKRATTVATTIRKHRLKFSTPQSAIGSLPPLSPFLPFPMIMLTSTTVSRYTFFPLPPHRCPLTFQLPTSRTPVFALYRSLDCRLICSSPPPFFLPLFPRYAPPTTDSRLNRLSINHHLGGNLAMER